MYIAERWKEHMYFGSHPEPSIGRIGVPINVNPIMSNAVPYMQCTRQSRVYVSYKCLLIEQQTCTKLGAASAGGVQSSEEIEWTVDAGY